MKIKIKKLCDSAVIPQYAHPTDAGMDLVAVSKSFDDDGNTVYGTGIAVEIPEGYVGLIFPRSSISKKDLLLTNSVGVIDSGYRGEIMAKFKNINRFMNPLVSWIPFCKWLRRFAPKSMPAAINKINEYAVGERIAQMIIVPYPHIEFEEVDGLSDSYRGHGGYGSTGK